MEIHTHPKIEVKLGLDKDHVIISRKDYIDIYHLLLTLKKKKEREFLSNLFCIKCGKNSSHCGGFC